MYYITKQNSKTGKRFKEISTKIEQVTYECKKVATQLGLKKWRPSNWLAYGGFYSIIFDTPPDPKVWKRIDNMPNEYMPKLNTTKGKQIQELLDATPRIGQHELNECIGFNNGAPWKTIGFAQNNKEYFGFEIGEDWNVKIPADCTEVTRTRYNELFKTTK